MIDLTCGAFWTHCALKCIAACDHEQVCEHPHGRHRNAPDTRVLPPGSGRDQDGRA